MSLLGCLAITEGYIVAYLLPPFYRKKVTLSAEAYQTERPNVEVSDLTALVIRALGMIVGQMMREAGTTGTTNATGTTRSVSWFIPTALITSAAQQIAEVQEIDISTDRITTNRISRVLKKMRLRNDRQPHGGKRGWSISLEEVIRWAASYGLDPNNITGLDVSSHISRGTRGFDGTRGTQGGGQPTTFPWSGTL